MTNCFVSLNVKNIRRSFFLKERIFRELVKYCTTFLDCMCTQNMSKTYFGCKSTKTYEKAQSAENNKKKTTHRNYRVISASPSRHTHNFIQIIFSSFTLLTAAANFKLKTSLTTAAKKMKILRFVILFFLSLPTCFLSCC